MLDLSDFHEACLLAHLAHLSEDLSDLCAMTTFEFTVHFQTKSPRYLIPAGFIKNRRLVKQCPSEALVCLQKGFVNSIGLISPYQVFVEEGLSRDPSWPQLQWGQDAVPQPAPAHSWSHGAAVVGAPSTGGSQGDPAEELWLLGCLQVRLKATGCGSLATQPTASFQHKRF